MRAYGVDDDPEGDVRFDMLLFAARVPSAFFSSRHNYA
jgi:hypothetical protein